MEQLIAQCDVATKYVQGIWHMSAIRDLISRALAEKDNQIVRNNAFEELVKRYQDAIFTYAKGVLKDAHLARDVVQDTLISSYENLEKLRNPDAFWPWIRTIARRECMYVIQQKKTVELSAGEENAIVSHHESPQQTLDATIRRERVQSAIDSLSETNRLPCVLYYFSGFSQAQISETLGLSLNVVKKRIQRARDQLKMEMSDMIRDAMGSDLPSNDSELLSRISLATSFENAARLGQLGLVEAMLVDGIDIDETDIKGRTLLHWAGHTGHMEAVQLLLKCGADTTVTDRTGKKPMSWQKNRETHRSRR